MKKFKIDKEYNNLKACDEIKNFIDREANNDEFNFMSKQLFDCLNIPEKVIKLKIKRILKSKYDFKKGTFELQGSFLKIILDYLITIGLLIFNAIPKRKKEKKNYELIIDDINEIDQAERFIKIISKLKSSLMIIKPSLKGKKSFFDKINHDKLTKIKSNFFFNSNVKLNSKTKILKLISIFLFVSIKKKINFVHFLKLIMITYLRYSNIFENYKSKVLIQDRFFGTCSIKNFLFKKNGGKYSCCTQIHLIESTISLFSDMDVLFSLGDEQDSMNKLKKLGGRVEKSLPMGSHKMEYLWHDNNKKNFEKDIDILIIGLNPISWFDISYDMQTDLFKFLKWMREISVKNPNYKIIYKHHPNFKYDTKYDYKENEIIKGSRIEKIKKLQKNNLSTYEYMARSKIVLSYGSTMVIEGMSNNNNCFFVCPSERSSIHFSDLKYLDRIIIKNFDDLEKKVETTIIKDSNFERVDTKICLDSKRVSNRIFEFVKSV